jgi:hypothetical protein
VVIANVKHTGKFKGSKAYVRNEKSQNVISKAFSLRSYRKHIETDGNISDKNTNSTKDQRIVF